MLLRTILAVLLCKTVLSMPKNDDKMLNDGGTNEEISHFMQSLGLGHLMNGADNVSVLINGNKADQVVIAKGGQLSMTVGKSLLLHGQSSLGKVESMIRRARNIFDGKLQDLMGKGTPPSEIKDDILLTTSDHNGQNNFTINYHHSPSVIQFNFFNKFPYANRNPCDLNPCQNGGICQVRESGNIQDYHCKCPTPLSGKNCTDVQCGGERCFHNGKIVIYFYNNESITWDNAKRQCEMRNMRLVKIPDEDTNEFVRRSLLHMYANDHTSQHCYYNGLYRTTAKGTFYWTDGSPLGGYRPWSSGKPEGQCVMLCSTTNYYFYWDIDPCNAADTNWQFYYICERKPSF